MVAVLALPLLFAWVEQRSREVGGQRDRAGALVRLQESVETLSSATQEVASGASVDAGPLTTAPMAIAREPRSGRSDGLRYSYVGEELYHEMVLFGPVGTSSDGHGTIW